MVEIVDIKTIPTSELEKDLEGSRTDISNCTQAILQGITTYSGGSVRKRLKDNEGFVKIITAELDRRKTLKGE